MSDGRDNMATMQRGIATSADVEEAISALKRNLDRRIDKFGLRKHISPAESLGILAEENHECIVAAQSNNVDDFLDEMMDVAVTGVWAWASHRHRKKR